MKGLKGGWFYKGLGGAGRWGQFDVAGQFIHLHYISLCCGFGVSAPLLAYHHLVTCAEESI